MKRLKESLLFLLSAYVMLCRIDKPSTSLDNENKKNKLVTQENAKITDSINRLDNCTQKKSRKLTIAN